MGDTHRVQLGKCGTEVEEDVSKLTKSIDPLNGKSLDMNSRAFLWELRPIPGDE